VQDAESWAAAPPVISPQGLGDARLGMTLGQLKQMMGGGTEFIPQPAFMVDFDAIAVQQSNQIQFYILHLAGQPLTDNDAIQGLLTTNPKFRTAEGIGPETSLQEAEQAYGEATLSYNTDNESREYVRFEQQPADNVSFGTGNANQQFAGVYASPASGYNETREFKPNATIQSVLVVCLTENCTSEN
jgi:hypothetical protein